MVARDGEYFTSHKSLCQHFVVNLSF